ncbi:ABC-2 type transport system ATP-binding protein [Raineyella antarctica]|uniref:ABC-2 type transport system ATP-binding protein n=1 Tax=Raineyella antarctica TaxID=1577474 RepID=A0A1G6GCS6_9ACTN|nr:ABC transporter ATP-binding protein [Raineyella antarctica]SDB79770.1 ABC-2 type transport system ATP-binding protein [Raineyella antarctica]
MPIIEVNGLRKTYGAREVLHGIDLTVDEGEIVGILGPNGAGKTTAVECIGGLRTPDAGAIRVGGIDPASNDPRLRQILGMQLQQCRLPAKITTAEAIDLFAAFYPDPRPTDELLERFGLTSQRDQRFEKLSGGQQQRLSVALALVGRPEVAILDELTTGLDPAARRDIWTYLEHLAAEGTTILLVTHSMEEAQHLCDRIYIIDAGRVVSQGTPDELAAAAGGQSISFLPSSPVPLDDLLSLPGVTDVRQDRDRIVVEGDAAAAQNVLAALTTRGVTAGQLRVTGPTLDDAYLRVTEED